MKLKGYSNYEIYPETGRVWSYVNKRYIGKETQGYVRVTLTDDLGRQKVWQMHRLIWLVVNGDIPEDMEINHNDENPLNNSIFNLSVMSHRDNVNWGNGNLKRQQTLLNNTACSKPVIAFKKGNLRLYFLSTQEAKRKGFRQEEISKCCNGKRHSHKGYEWKYQDDYLADWWEETCEDFIFN